MNKFNPYSEKILVTGGAGFIGSNLVEALLKEGYFVRCLDNFSTGHRANISSFIELYPETFELIEGDIRSIDDCRAAISDINYVFHQAALGSVPRSVKDPITTNEVNVNGFLNMLLASRDAAIKRFIFASSSSVYGDNNTLPKLEEHIGKPRSPYATSKISNEYYADVFARSYGLDYIGLRYFNVFGRRQDPNGAYAAVIPLFIKQLIRKEAPTINGDGSFSRDFTYIDNVIEMNMLALKTKETKAVNQIYNTACAKAISLNELVAHLQEALSRFIPEVQEIKAIYSNSRLGDIPHSLASIKKAEELLGYQVKHFVKEGLEETVKWYWEHSPYNTKK